MTRALIRDVPRCSSERIKKLAQPYGFYTCLTSAVFMLSKNRTPNFFVITVLLSLGRRTLEMFFSMDLWTVLHPLWEWVVLFISETPFRGQTFTWLLMFAPWESLAGDKFQTTLVPSSLTLKIDVFDVQFFLTYADDLEKLCSKAAHVQNTLPHTSETKSRGIKLSFLARIFCFACLLFKLTY